jgi:site-specific recombinase XerD
MGEITLQQAFDEYKTVYMPARNLAGRTREEYANDLRGFIDFLDQPGITKTEQKQQHERYTKNI